MDRRIALGWFIAITAAVAFAGSYDDPVRRHDGSDCQAGDIIVARATGYGTVQARCEPEQPAEEPPMSRDIEPDACACIHIRPLDDLLDRMPMYSIPNGSYGDHMPTYPVGPGAQLWMEGGTH